MQHNHNKSVRIPRNHTSGSCEVHRHIAEKALPKTMPRNEIKHAARVLSRYRDARRTRILLIRLRLTVRVKKPVKSPGYPEIFHRFFQLFFFCAVGTYSRLPLRLLCRSPRPRLCSTEPVSQRDKTRCASFISLSRRSPHTNTSHSAAAHCSRKKTCEKSRVSRNLSQVLSAILLLCCGNILPFTTSTPVPESPPPALQY